MLFQRVGSASVANFTWAHGTYATPGAPAAAAFADMPVYNKVSVPQARSSAAKNSTVHAARVGRRHLQLKRRLPWHAPRRRRWEQLKPRAWLRKPHLPASPMPPARPLA